MNDLNPQESLEGTNTYAIEKSDIVHLLFLSANVESTITTNINTRTVSIIAQGEFFMGRGDTPITYPSATQSPSTLEYIPAVRKVQGEQVLRFISNVDTIVEVSEYL